MKKLLLSLAVMFALQSAPMLAKMSTEMIKGYIEDYKRAIKDTESSLKKRDSEKAREHFDSARDYLTYVKEDAEQISDTSALGVGDFQEWVDKQEKKLDELEGKVGKKASKKKSK
jgi:hypothetical protein